MQETIDIPVHDFVLAAYCTNPILVISSRLGVDISSPRLGPQEISLPIVSIRVEHPDLFSSIVSFLHTLDADEFLSAILPIGHTIHFAADGLDESVKQHMRSIQSPPMFYNLTLRIWNARKTLLEMGVKEYVIWDTLRVAWDIMFWASCEMR